MKIGIENDKQRRKKCRERIALIRVVSVNEIEILSFLNVHRYVIIGTFKSRKSEKEGRKANREEEKG